MAKKKSSFYHVRYNRVSINETKAAEILGVSLEDVQRYDKEGAPVMAERLLLLWDNKRVGVQGWDGVIFTRGVLKHKNYRWTPRTIILFREQDEEIRLLKHQIAELQTWRGLNKTFLAKIKNPQKAIKQKH